MNGSRTLVMNFIFFVLIIVIYLYFEESKNSAVKANEAEKKNIVKNSNRNKIMKNIYQKLNTSERNVYSQHNADGVIESIFQLLNIKDLKRYYVEINVGTGMFARSSYSLYF